VCTTVTAKPNNISVLPTQILIPLLETVVASRRKERAVYFLRRIFGSIAIRVSLKTQTAIEGEG
jgi:hypothetical protein